MEKLFQLKANGTTVRTELLAGLTTFMTMAYIIALNPNLLTNFAVGTPLWNGVFLATCIASAIGTICMAFLANKPFVMAPGMGLNSFFAVVVANIAVINECEYETAFQAALVIILVEGIVFLILTLLKVREKIVEAIPLGVRYGIAPAIGLMLMNVGLGSNVGIYAEGNGFASPFYMMRDFFGALTPSIIKGSMGEVGYHTMVPHRCDGLPRRVRHGCACQEGREGGGAARYALLLRHLLGGQRHLPACEPLCKPCNGKLCSALCRHGLHHALQV